MTVIVRHDYLHGEKAKKDWWMGQVIHCGGAAHAPSVHNLLQIADVDSGMIRWVNADLVTQILGLMVTCISSRILSEPSKELKP